MLQEEFNMYTYTWYQWLTFFYIYCFFGWIFESSYVSLKQHRFVNRGFLRLPMLPLYGSGAIMMLWVSMPVQDNLFFTWCAGVIGATCLEYVTGYVMEQLFKVRYWDYSNQKFNIHGYICLTSSIAWGFLTIFMTHVIHRPIERAVLSMPVWWDLLFVIIISIVFIYDSVVCVREALSLAESLESLNKLRQELDNIQVQRALLKMEAQERLESLKEQADLRKERLLERRSLSTISLEELRDMAGGALDNLRDLKSIHLEELKDKTEKQLAELLKEKERSVSAIRRRHLAFRRNRLRSNPSASSAKYRQEFKDLKDFFESGKAQFPD